MIDTGSTEQQRAQCVRFGEIIQRRTEIERRLVERTMTLERENLIMLYELRSAFQGRSRDVRAAGEMAKEGEVI